MNIEVKDDVRVVFCIHKVCYDPASENIGLVGSHRLVGDWNTADSPLAHYLGFSAWQFEMMLPKNRVLKYKLFLINPRNNFLISIENCGERELKLEEAPLFVELHYNDTDVKVREMKSRLTKSGCPVIAAVSAPDMSDVKLKQRGWDMDEDDCDESHYSTVEYTMIGEKMAAIIHHPRVWNNSETGNKLAKDFVSDAITHESEVKKSQQPTHRTDVQEEKMQISCGCPESEAPDMHERETKLDSELSHMQCRSCLKKTRRSVPIGHVHFKDLTDKSNNAIATNAADVAKAAVLADADALNNELQTAVSDIIYKYNSSSALDTKSYAHAITSGFDHGSTSGSSIQTKASCSCMAPYYSHTEFRKKVSNFRPPLEAEKGSKWKFKTIIQFGLPFGFGLGTGAAATYAYFRYKL